MLDCFLKNRMYPSMTLKGKIERETAPNLKKLQPIQCEANAAKTLEPNQPCTLLIHVLRIAYIYAK